MWTAPRKWPVITQIVILFHLELTIWFRAYAHDVSRMEASARAFFRRRRQPEENTSCARIVFRELKHARF